MSNHLPRTGWAAGCVGATLCLLLGCGAYEPGQDDGVDVDPDIDSETRAWSIPSCAAATAHQTFQYGITDPGVYTGTNYNRCGHSYVIDVNNFQQVAGYDPLFNVHWNSPVPSYTQGACTRSSSSDSSYLWMGFYLYEKQGNNWVYKETREDFGEWKTSGLCWNPNGYIWAPCCEPPYTFFNGLVNGRTYRVAATARQYGGDCASTSLGFCKVQMHILNGS